MGQKINPVVFERKLNERGLTAQRLQAITRLSPSTLAKIHKGEELSLRSVLKISNALAELPVVVDADLLEPAS